MNVWIVAGVLVAITAAVAGAFALGCYIIESAERSTEEQADEHSYGDWPATASVEVRWHDGIVPHDSVKLHLVDSDGRN